MVWVPFHPHVMSQRLLAPPPLLDLSIYFVYSFIPYFLFIYLPYCFSYPIREHLFFSLELLLVLYDYRMKCTLNCPSFASSTSMLFTTSIHTCIGRGFNASICIHITSCSQKVSFHNRVLSFMPLLENIHTYMVVSSRGSDEEARVS